MEIVLAFLDIVVIGLLYPIKLQTKKQVNYLYIEGTSASLQQLHTTCLRISCSDTFRLETMLKPTVLT